MLGKQPQWTLTQRQICDIEMILTGGFLPLATFLNKKDYELNDMIKVMNHN